MSMENLNKTNESKLFAEFTSIPGVIFIRYGTFGVFVHMETKIVMGTCDGLNKEDKLINPKRNITSEQAQLVDARLTVPDEIVGRPEIVPYVE